MKRWLLALTLALAMPATAETLRVGSKRFTESYILAEIVLRSALEAGAEVEHRPGLGNTGIVFAALRAGSIDLYPDYTGTIARELLKLEGDPSLATLSRALASEGLGVAVPLGFDNTYALAMRSDLAERLGIRDIGDLERHPRLRLGLSPEFLGRADGWSGLRTTYRLPYRTPAGLDHGLAYEAIAAGNIDLLDVYSTDAKIKRYALRVLKDNRAYFPKYDAVLVYRLDVPSRFPAAWQAVRRLEGRLDAETMIRLNAAAELEGNTFADAAALFVLFDSATGAANGARQTRHGFLSRLVARDFWRLTREHLLLSFGSLLLAIVVAIPLGVVAVKRPGIAQALLATVGVIQTIPSLALLAFLIAVVGTIGFWPALIALFLYALLPIVRNTHTGLANLPPGLHQAGLALGLSGWVRLWSIELPLAWPTILAGIKTAAVINIGTATIAAFIGAGGYGERIAQGLALNDSALLLAGAVPAAGLALLTQWAFERLERASVVNPTRPHV